MKQTKVLEYAMRGAMEAQTAVTHDVEELARMLASAQQHEAAQPLLIKRKRGRPRKLVVQSIYEDAVSMAQERKQ